MMTSTVVAIVAVQLTFLSTICGIEGRVVYHRSLQPLAGRKMLTLTLMTPEQEEKKVYLSLKKDTSLTDVPTYVNDKNGRLIRWQEPEGYSLENYIDEESQASFVVEKMQDSQGRVVERYRGSFVDDNKVYWLAPMLTRSSSVSKRDDRFQPLNDAITVRIGDVNHFVSPAKSDFAGEYDNIVTSAKFRQKSYTSRYDARGQTVYTVELLMVVDYSLYEYWYTTYASFTDPFKKENEALLLLRHYFAGVAYGINRRYISMNQPDFEIRVQLVGFYIAQTSADSWFTEDSDVRMNYLGYDYVQMNKCLQKFGSWVSQNSKLYGGFDHAVLYVGNYLYDKLVQGVPQTKSGLANVGGVCKVSEGLCTSINYERGFYSSSQTGAHELGHNLGAAHDEENNECTTADQYVMASSPGNLPKDIRLHPYTFSPCSIRYFREFLAKLNKEGDNCLLTKNSPVDVNFPITWPGVIQDVDQQCYSYQGSGSFYCAGMIHDGELCEKIICWNTDINQCVWESVEHRAYTGTPCANKKWCMMGECVADDNAPEMNDTCIYGDFRGYMYISEAHPRINCTQMVKQFPEECYSEDRQKRCCIACPSIRKNDKPDCEFGDKRPARCLTGKKVNCYDVNFNKDCCDWCEKQMGDDQSCLFGDKADWCSTITSDQCYSSEDKCCETCKKFVVLSAGEKCKYGDTVGWCASQDLNEKTCQSNSDIGKQCCGSCAKKFPNGFSTNANNPSIVKPPAGGTAKCPNGDLADYCSDFKKKPASCYAAKDVCCATCEKLDSGVAGCEYGDQMDGCEGQVDQSYCQDQGVFQQCCKTCLKLQKRHSLDLIEQLLQRLE